MDLLTIFLIAIALAMDAFTVSIAAGVVIRKNRLRIALMLAVCFGIFQGGMPILGYFAGIAVQNLVSFWAPWIGFLLLSAIGAKMCYEGITNGPNNQTDYTSPAIILMLSVATSIDALAIGLGFAVLGTPILGPAIIIGIVTLILSFAGFFGGSLAGDTIGSKTEILGGIILILIGLKILLF